MFSLSTLIQKVRKMTCCVESCGRIISQWICREWCVLLKVMLDSDGNFYSSENDFDRTFCTRSSTGDEAQFTSKLSCPRDTMSPPIMRLFFSPAVDSIYHMEKNNLESLTLGAEVNTWDCSTGILSEEYDLYSRF